MFALTLAVCISFLLGACGGGSKTDVAQHIPSEMTAALSIDLDQILQKGDLNNPGQYSFLQEMFADAKDAGIDLEAILKDPSVTGLSIDELMYIYVDVAPEDSEPKLVGMTISVKDADKFEAFAQKSGMPAMTEKEGYKLLDQGDVKIGLTASALTIIQSEDEALAVASITGTHETSLADNEAFQAAMKQGTDIQLWVSSAPFAANVGKDMVSSMALQTVGIQKEALKENHMQAGLNFEDGQLTFLLELALVDEIKEKLYPFFKGEVATDFAQYFPAKKLQTYSVMGLSLIDLIAFLEAQGMIGMADAQLKSMGLSLETISKGIDGDMAVASYLSDNPMPGYTDEAEILVALAIKDKAAFTQLLDLLPRFMGIGLEKTETGYRGPGFELILKDDILFITSSTALAEAVRTGTNTGLPAERVKALNGVAAAGFSLGSSESLLVEQLSSPDAFYEAGPFAIVLSKMAEEMEFSQFTMHKGHLEAKAVLKDKSQNSLKRLLLLADDSYLNMDTYMEKIQEKRRQRENHMLEQEKMLLELQNM